MYSFLRGKIAFIENLSVALDVSGVGFKVYTTARTLDSCAEKTDMLFYTHLVVKEDDISIYGFETRQEKMMFEKLISVSGVGPKAALAILSQMTIGDIGQALLVGDAKAFSKVNGIGPKTAARIILELKDKIDIEDVICADNVVPSGVTAESEAVEALMGIGYTKAEAVNAVKAVSSLADTAEDLTLLALKRLAM